MSSPPSSAGLSRIEPRSDAPSARTPLNLRSGNRATDGNELDMTPMVDVTFLLLIFFMITAAFALQKAIEVPPSRQDAAATTQTMDELEEDSIVVRVDGDNIYWVGCPSWPEEEKAPSKQDMRTWVRKAREEAPSKAFDSVGPRGFNKLLVQASGDATHEFVVAALDAGSAIGAEEIRLMSYEEDDF